MRKYTKDDIKILSEGHQVRRAIEEKYSTLKNFTDIEKPELSLKSIYNYCGNKRVRSDKFKLLVIRALDIGYNELILSNVNQVKKYAYDIFYSIHLYNSEEDVQTFETVIDLCEQYNLQTEIAVMMRNCAKNLYRRNKLNDSIKMYSKAIDYISTNKIDISELIIVHVDLADIYFKEKDILKSNDNFEIARCYLANEAVNDRAKYYYYYYRGIAKNKAGRHEEARKYFNDALNFAKVNNNVISQKGAVLMNIGNTYRRENNYTESSKYFFGALLHFHDSDTHGRCAIQNNIADNYYMQKNYNEAFKYMDKALKTATQNGLSNASLLLAQTSGELIMLNKEKSSCTQYFKVLRDSVNCPVDKYIIIQNIIALIKAMKFKEDLLQLKEILYYLKSNTDNKEYIHDLYSCIGRINEKIEVMKGKIENEENQLFI